MNANTRYVSTEVSPHASGRRAAARGRGERKRATRGGGLPGIDPCLARRNSTLFLLIINL